MLDVAVEGAWREFLRHAVLGEVEVEEVGVDLEEGGVEEPEGDLVGGDEVGAVSGEGVDVRDAVVSVQEGSLEVVDGVQVVDELLFVDGVEILLAGELVRQGLSSGRSREPGAGSPGARAPRRCGGRRPG